jgi:uncharacterized phage protein (TIGR01671 family)
VDYKFRGKRKDTGEWVYGSLVQYRDEWFIVSFDSICFDAQYGDVWISFPQSKALVIPETVGMFTGLKDKNGAEIYEGDILQDVDTGIIKKIEYHGHTFMLVDENRYFYSVYYSENYEIIGNAHDNPKLLEVHNA